MGETGSLTATGRRTARRPPALGGRRHRHRRPPGRGGGRGGALRCDRRAGARTSRRSCTGSGWRTRRMRGSPDARWLGADGLVISSPHRRGRHRPHARRAHDGVPAARRRMRRSPTAFDADLLALAGLTPDRFPRVVRPRRDRGHADARGGRRRSDFRRASRSSPPATTTPSARGRPVSANPATRPTRSAPPRRCCASSRTSPARTRGVRG